uniref:Glutaredoxin-C6 n=1 Tax=Anthurium amnicola TaxID=1678845 RepID=A0A1D1XXS0_9ARAE
MQGVRCHPAMSKGGVGVDLAGAKKKAVAAPLSIDVAETPEKRVERLIAENPVIIFSRSSCCMCHVMKRLLSTIGVHPMVIELDDAEIDRAMESLSPPSSGGDPAVAPAVFIGGTLVGGLESLMGLHLRGLLVPMLREVGALWSS